MSKEIKIRIKDADQLVFEILEDSKQGDYFCLKNINNIDFTNLQTKILEKKDEYVNQLIAKEKSNFINEFKLSDDYRSKERRINELEKNESIWKEKIQNEYSKARADVEKDFVFKIGKLEQEIDSLKKQHSIEIDNTKLKVQNELQTKISTLENQFTQINEKHKLDLREKEMEYSSKIEQIQREKNLNVKLLGNELENTLLQYYNDALSINDDCSLERTTKDVDGTKPDFIFKVIDYDKSVLGSVIIEAKTQLPNSSTSKKNKEYFNKLEIDRKKHNAEFSLLVTELEQDDIFVIKKENSYENMFVVRPAYFISFLSIMRYLFLKRRDIKKSEINFKNKQEIMNDFNKLKNEILDNSIKNIDKNVQEIIKCADNVSKHAQTITDSANVILNKHLETVKNKIENFKIQGIIKQIDNLEK